MERYMIKDYEERYLLTLLSAIINQKAVPEPMRQIDWNKMFRLADYHHVAHMVYYGIMGLESSVPQLIRERFFNKYLEAVFRAERLRAGEKELRGLLENGRVDCFILDYYDIVKCYPIEEMCCCEFLEVGTDKKHAKLLDELLKKGDFEEYGTDLRARLFYKVPGIKVLCINNSLFFNRQLRKYFKSLFVSLPYRKGWKYIHKMSPSEKYIYLMVRLTDCYARGDISLSQIVDFWAYYKKYAEYFSWPYIYDKLKKLKIGESAERLELLILRWFSSGVGMENVEIYDAMESYILSKGSHGREASSKFLPLTDTVVDNQSIDKKENKWRKLLKWLFPDRNYMLTIYPQLENKGFLLPLFWILRLFRNLIFFIGREMQEKLILNLKECIQKLVGLFQHKRKKEKEIEEQIGKENIKDDKRKNGDI